MKLTKEQVQEALDLSEHHGLFYNEVGQYMPWIKDGNPEGDGFNEEILAFARAIRESVLAEIEADGYTLDAWAAWKAARGVAE